MKLIIAIVQDEDASRLVSNLMSEGYGVTKLATTGGFLRADVLQVAKSGFSSLTRDEADSLENYAITHGINRGKWLRPFSYGDDAADMDELRVRLISPVEALRDALRRDAGDRGRRDAGEGYEAVRRIVARPPGHAPLHASGARSRAPCPSREVVARSRR